MPPGSNQDEGGPGTASRGPAATARGDPADGRRQGSVAEASGDGTDSLARRPRSTPVTT